MDFSGSGFFFQIFTYIYHRMGMHFSRHEIERPLPECNNQYAFGSESLTFICYERK